VARSSLDWGYAYEMAIRDHVERYSNLRAEGSAALVRVPGTCQSYCIRDLDDDEIRSAAIFEAEKIVNRSIHQHTRKD
jgi:hypothetical protein